MQWTKSISIFSTSRAPPKCGFFRACERAGASAVASQAPRRTNKGRRIPRDTWRNTQSFTVPLSYLSHPADLSKLFLLSSRWDNKSDPQRVYHRRGPRDGAMRPIGRVRNVRGGGKGVRSHARFTRRPTHLLNGINLHAPRLNERLDRVSAPRKPAGREGSLVTYARGGPCSAWGTICERESRPFARRVPFNVRKLIIKIIAEWLLHETTDLLTFSKICQRDRLYVTKN